MTKSVSRRQAEIGLTWTKAPADVVAAILGDEDDHN